MRRRGRLEALIATDLDGTLVGDAASLARLNGDLARVRHRVGLVYVTGRVLPSVLALIASEGLLAPDAIIAAVGTTIHWAPGWTMDAAWEQRMREAWCAAAVDTAADAIAAIRRQPAEAQGPFKRSFWLDPREARAAMGTMARELRARQLHARMVYSSDRDLDVIPARGGKGPATRYMFARLGVSPERVITCGDSGNDVDLLAAGGISAIVANARPELLRRAPPQVFRTTRPFAGGVHEALKRFGFV